MFNFNYVFTLHWKEGMRSVKLIFHSSQVSIGDEWKRALIQNIMLLSQASFNSANVDSNLVFRYKNGQTLNNFHEHY